MKQKQYIKAEIQSLAKSEILDMVPADTLARIKQTDKKPEFRIYCVGHEGTATAQELNFGQKLQKAFRYIKNIIIKLSDKLTLGTPIFNRHIDTNEHIGREQIGELVGKGLKFMKDKLSALAAIYVYPQYRKMSLDVASIEADIEYIPKSKNEAEVLNIDKITGIALSSSEVDKPAFPGASLLGIIQAFTKKEGDEKMTIEEIKDAIKEGSFKITDLFTMEEIAGSEPAKKAKQTEYEHAKRIEKSLGDEREKVITLTKQLEESQGKVKTFNEKINSAQVKSLFEQSVEVRKFDDKEKAFIEKNLGSFKSEKEGDELKQDFDKFLDNQLKEFGEYAKILGVDVKKDDKGKGTPPADGKDFQTEEDFMNPEKNEFIPK